MAAPMFKLFSWGANSHGQLCAGHKNDEHVPVEVPSTCVEDAGFRIADVQQICGGGSHVVFLTNKGNVYSCGQNNKNQLGHLPVTDQTFGSTTLKLVQNVEGFCISKVVCGWEHTLCMTIDGNLWGWGANNYGQLGLPNVSNINEPAEIKIVLSEKVVDIAAGPRHSLAVTETGGVYAWGCGRRGQLGCNKADGLTLSEIRDPMKVAINARIVSVACGMHHSLALSDRGEVYAWGCNQHGIMAHSPSLVKQNSTPTKILFPGNSNIARVLSGWSHAIAISGKLLTSRIAALHFLKNSQEIFTWGRNDYGQLGRGGSAHVPTALESLNLSLETQSTAISAGAEHNLAVNSNQKIVSWGWNEHGICGVEGDGDVRTPRIINCLQAYTARLIGCGYGTSFAIVH